MLQKRLIDDVRKQGKLISVNPFKEIDLKNYNVQHYAKQKALLNEYSKEIEEGNRYLAERSNINDEEGLKKAYNGETEDSLYYHPNNRTLYIAGTKDIPRDLIDDLFIPHKMVHLSKRYEQADNFIQRHRDKIDKVVGHSLGGAVAMKLNEDNGKRFSVRTYNAPLTSWELNEDKKETRLRTSRDMVSFFDRGANAAVNKEAVNPLYNHEYQSKFFRDVGKQEANSFEPIRAIM